MLPMVALTVTDKREGESATEGENDIITSIASR